ncbi:hypothetical protein HMPREF0204_10519 [Chryseobacterium gleum ATCC 35910]|uniref:Uncharacterized protein n=1 Tax=Chryseobacterium gleum ATCC 35910 TaxID=525257 RepID=A0ABN0AX87_CHRGE|nr:hypothetical protein HMPREF0204_10519 [Chryseobacterium gleum ATCC 35910]
MNDIKLLKPKFLISDLQNLEQNKSKISFYIDIILSFLQRFVL